VITRPDLRSRAGRSYARLSAKGLERFKETHAPSHEFEDWLASVIGPEDLAAATRALAKMRTHLKGPGSSERSKAMTGPGVDNERYRRLGHSGGGDEVGEFSTIRFFVKTCWRR
jgi:hypothetical protein